MLAAEREEEEEMSKAGMPVSRRPKPKKGPRPKSQPPGALGGAAREGSPSHSSQEDLGKQGEWAVGWAWGSWAERQGRGGGRGERVGWAGREMGWVSGREGKGGWGEKGGVGGVGAGGAGSGGVGGPRDALSRSQALWRGK